MEAKMQFARLDSERIYMFENEKVEERLILVAAFTGTEEAANETPPPLGDGCTPQALGGAHGSKVWADSLCGICPRMKRVAHPKSHPFFRAPLIQ